MRFTTFNLALLVCCLGRFTAFSFAQDASIEEIVYSGGFYPRPHAVSSDGTVVTGRVEDDDIIIDVGFRWTGSQGSRLFPSGDGLLSDGIDVSGDGRTFVGWVYDAPFSGVRAFRFSGGKEMLSVAPQSARDSSALSVSYDGQTIVGNYQVSGGKTRAFRWRAGEGAQDLGTLYGGRSSASALSDDGRVAAGYSRGKSGGLCAFRWTARDGMIDLGSLARRSGVNTRALGISRDGRVIVGVESEMDSEIDRPWAWTRREGVVALSVGDGIAGRANAANGDGSVIVGSIDEFAAVWIDREPYYLRDVLEAAGVDLTDYWGGLVEATDCSRSGRVVVGRSSELAFRAVLPFRNRPPVSDLGRDSIVVRTSENRASVELDGSASRDPDGDGLRYRWSAKGVRFEDETLRETAGFFPIGTTRVTLTVRDEVGIEDSATMRVVVKQSGGGVAAECELD